MNTIDVPASNVRVPALARQALAAHQVVEVTSHGTTSIVMIHPDDFVSVRPILERRRRGLPVPIDELLDDDDFALLAEIRAGDGAEPVGIAPSWL